MPRIALFGGLYSNYLALEAALGDVKRRGADAIYCLGDLGAFGPHPDRIFPLVRDNYVQCLQGNYDDSIGNQRADCQCGYTDPRDNYFAQRSYDYTLANTSTENRRWLQRLPRQIRFELGPLRVLLCHGSPRRVNEFLWESTSSTHFLASLLEQFQADLIAGTHTGMKWQRSIGTDKRFVNVGVLGRPENDGRTCVWYTLFDYSATDGLRVEFVPVEYDYRRLAVEMRQEELPDEFVQTIMTGWWTTCLEVLPSKERRRGKF